MAMPQGPAGASLSGTIEFKGVSVQQEARVHVRVQDTTRVGAAAVTVAEQVLERVTIAPGSPPLMFKVTGIPHNPQARYTVRVHADVDGNGVVSRGDYVSTQSYHVDPAAPHPIAIVAQPVR
jgi:Type III secretion system lipoprotein chaperone (YscW)